MDNIQNYEQSNEQYQSIKPAIKSTLIFFNSLGISLIVMFFFLMWGGSFIIGFIGMFFGTKVLSFSVIGTIGFFVVVLFIVYFWQYFTLTNTEYKFYSNRVEYFEGFLVKNRKTITYDKISNIGQRKGIVEGFFGLGTIFVDTPGSSTKGHELSISYLENPDRVYDWISKVISKKSG